MSKRGRGQPTLLLFPTQLERQRFEDLGGIRIGYALQHVCGFGPVAAAARTAQLCQTLKPWRVILAGIAGTYAPEAFPVGEACAFRHVGVHGIGAGEGEDYQGPPALGFPQWPDAQALGVPRIEDRLELAPLVATDAQPLLLTTCAASDSFQMAHRRREQFPDAIAEDMEGFGVALACRLAGVDVSIVRGFSNEVGDRDSHNWRIPAALAAARRVLLEAFETEEQDLDRDATGPDARGTGA